MPKGHKEGCACTCCQFKRKEHKGVPLSMERKKRIGKANKKSIKKLWENKKYREMMINSHKGYKIPITTRRKMSEAHKREKAPAWKGGITPLTSAIRALLEYKLWRSAIFERDNYTCQECGARSGNGKAIILHADHIKMFNIIFNEFLQEYNQFSPYEDRETLLRLATTYKFFWDINNGQTLCNECHYNKTWNKELTIRKEN
jgi:hypothetical protein